MFVAIATSSWYLSGTLTELTVQVGVLADKVKDITEDEKDLPERVAALEAVVAALLLENQIASMERADIARTSE